MSRTTTAPPSGASSSPRPSPPLPAKATTGPRFAEITFTSSVKATQTRYGTRHNNERYEQSGGRRNVLTAHEVEFLEERDSFYQATVGDNGWPYVQHRGGPRGFLRVIDERTIGFADFRGNLQYISVGNLGADDRVSIILVDYPNRRRLKILGRARIVDEAQDPQLVASLKVDGYRGKVERGIIITIEAFDWNCPQHITPRFTEEEVLTAVAPLRERIAELEAELASLRRPAA